MMIHPIHSIVEWWMWILFTFLIVFLIIVDIFSSSHHGTEKVSTKEALGWSIFWISLAILFNIFLWWHLYGTKGLAIANEYAVLFLLGYVVEELLSIENMFIFLLIFNYFNLPARHHRQALLYGILGAIIFRFIMIMSSVWVISQFHWVIYLFGAFLIYSGTKMLFVLKSEKFNFSENKLLGWMKNNLNITEKYHGKKLFIPDNNQLFVTPLFVVIVFIQITDIIFAVESLPAIFGITQDPFIIYSSNILALLGLRSVYFLIVNLSQQFHLLKHCISIILVLIGLKMLMSKWIFVSTYSLAGIIFTVIIFSLIINKVLKAKV